ncbi:MAG TPA: carbohydrate ABC transporter substrate-binding protein [Candidatus Scybalocola faecipullorum]|nr:carbohydrate ABC transporter substrate-binding protein [Candidatus Scybalocola faecipullorum]
MKKGQKLTTAVLTVLMAMAAMTGCGDSGETPAGGDSSSADNSEDKTLSLLTFSDIDQTGLQAVCDLAEEKLGIHIDIEVVANGDDVIQTRAASGDLNDLVISNSGAILSTLHPADYFIPLNDETEIMDKLDDTYIESVTVDDVTYGIPQCSTQVGCVLYNKSMYEQYGLEVPQSWEEFTANCQTLKDNGETALIGAFGDAWTSQVLMLGDFYNLNEQDPDFAKNFEAGEDKYASNEYALRSFTKYEDLLDFYNEDYLAAIYDDGCQKLAEGEGAHWIMLTQVLGNIYSLFGEEATNNIGAFPIPCDDPSINGMTVWMPNSIYGNKNTGKTETILEFMNFYLSDEALDAFTTAQLPQGPYCVKGYEIPDTAYEAVRVDMQKYFDEGKTCTAMEFITSVKGNGAEKICQEVACGLSSGAEAAQKYDEDAYKAAVQLGLDWEQ